LVPLADGQAEAVLALRRALRDTSEVGQAMKKVLAAMPSLQAAELLEDEGLSSPLLQDGLDARLRRVAALSPSRSERPGAP
jgi:hypothetical protein